MRKTRGGVDLNGWVCAGVHDAILDLCWFSVFTTTEHIFVYYIFYTTLGGDSGYIYCVTLIDNKKFSNDISWKSGQDDILEITFKIDGFWWRNYNTCNLQDDN